MPGWVWVAFGGAAGAVCRHAVNSLMHRAGGAPVSTLTVNVLGSLLLGLLVSVLVVRGATTAESPMRLMIATGFCGAFTTMSALALETHRLFEHGSPASALSYSVVNLVLSVAALAVGVAAGRALVA